MSQREQSAEAKQLLGEIIHELNTAPLTFKQRSELQFHASELSGLVFDHPKAKQVLSRARTFEPNAART